MSNIDGQHSPSSELPLGDNDFIQQVFHGTLTEEPYFHFAYLKCNPVF